MQQERGISLVKQRSNQRWNEKKINRNDPTMGPPMIDNKGNRIPEGKKYPDLVRDPCVWKQNSEKGTYVPLTTSRVPNE